MKCETKARLTSQLTPFLANYLYVIARIGITYEVGSHLVAALNDYHEITTALRYCSSGNWLPVTRNWPVTRSSCQRFVTRVSPSNELDQGSTMLVGMKNRKESQEVGDRSVKEDEAEAKGNGLLLP